MSLANWVPCSRPSPACLIGQSVHLERLNWAEHLRGLHAAVGGLDSVWTYMPIGPFANVEDFHERFDETAQTHGWETLVIRDSDTSDILGMASYMRIREAHGSAEVGCVAFGDGLKRTVRATEAMFLMAAHLFDTLGYRRYEWKCHNKNEASKSAAARLGFQYEGTFRNDMVLKGMNRDTAWFAMTDEDWPEIKAGFLRWLDPLNFHADGTQKSSLQYARVKVEDHTEVREN